MSEGSERTSNSRWSFTVIPELYKALPFWIATLVVCTRTLAKAPQWNKQCIFWHGFRDLDVIFVDIVVSLCAIIHLIAILWLRLGDAASLVYRLLLFDIDISQYVVEDCCTDGCLVEEPLRMPSTLVSISAVKASQGCV